MSGERQLPNWLKSIPDHTDSANATLRSIQEDSLPQLDFSGTIHYYTDHYEAAAACDDIYRRLQPRRYPSIGLDMEWKVNYGPDDKTDVLQLCPGPDECHIFHLSAMTDFPKMLRVLLEEPFIVKVGLNVEGDLWRLGRGSNRFPAQKLIQSGSVVELNDLARKVLNKPGERWSLDRLVVRLLNHSLPKEAAIRLSDWSQVPLSTEQKRYAALDAYASWLCYDTLRKQLN